MINTQLGPWNAWDKFDGWDISGQNLRVLSGLSQLMWTKPNSINFQNERIAWVSVARRQCGHIVLRGCVSSSCLLSDPFLLFCAIPTGVLYQHQAVLPKPFFLYCPGMILCFKVPLVQDLNLSAADLDCLPILSTIKIPDPGCRWKYRRLDQF